MTPKEFIEKWRAAELKERSASQTHFNDLCQMLGFDDPITSDPKGEWFTFERGASKTGGGEGWADVWRKGCFGWEYKGKKKDLDKAYAQLQQYSVALENPPLLIVSDMDRFRIHTNWTNTVQQVHEFSLDDLEDAATRDLLRHAFEDPERLKPAKTRQTLTEEAATKFADLALRLRSRGYDPQVVAHFVNRLVFCMFAEDVRLLPNSMFTRMLEHCERSPSDFETHARTLFAAMKDGGMVGFEKVEWFNGGLFDSDDALPLDKTDVKEVLAAARLDWSDIDPSILGTLFERGLDPDKRSQLGAHYTDRDKIMMIVDPVIVEPLTREWEETRDKIETLIEGAPKETAERLLRGSELAARTKALNSAERLHIAFIERLKAFRVLDPACGSGNFLYLSLLALKDLEHRANLEAEVLGLRRQFPSVGPECVKGIEINPYAAELARVSVWIGEIQWMRRNGFDAARDPILRPLGTIECRDAILNDDGTRAEWPDADVVVGNPPFVGNKKMIGELGEEYVSTLRDAWEGAVSSGADLVTFWFAKAWALIEADASCRAGLVATQSIRRGANREVLQPIIEGGRIFDAWDDEEWTVDGAAVRVSLICFDHARNGPAKLDGVTVQSVNSDLTAGLDLQEIRPIPQNAKVAFQGTIKTGPFEVNGETAREWLTLPVNPNARTNADVLRPWANGQDVTGRPSGQWIIDFGTSMSEEDAALYEVPFRELRGAIDRENEARASNGKPPLRGREVRSLDGWWIHQRARGEMRNAIAPFERYIATPRVSKFRLFIWLNKAVLPDTRLVVFARDDDSFFGILHSRFHEVWSLRHGGWHGDGKDGGRPQYTPSNGFETFPFPSGLSPDIPSANYNSDPRAKKIASAAALLNKRRENWLNPSNLIEREPEVVAGYPDRILPKDDSAAKTLKKRTLTNLYNERPAWLDHAHRALDEAVAEAYGWGDDWCNGNLTDDEILARLFALNQERAAG